MQGSYMLVIGRSEEELLLEMRNIHAGYGKAEVLHGISLEVYKKEFVGVIGPNGAGKSTLLKSIMGFVRPSKGEIVFQNESIVGLPPNKITRRGIGYVPSQGRTVFPGLTVLENLMMGGYCIGDKDGMNRSLSQSFDLFPALRARKNQKAGTLSGGEQQMVNIARSIMNDPVLLVLDEPSMGLAPRLVDIIFGKLERLNELGMAIVLVEQSVRKALEICSWACIIGLGKVLSQCKSTEAFSHDDVTGLFLDG